MIASLRSKPTIAIFWAWVIVNVCFWGVSVFDGSLHELMLRAVDYAAAHGTEVDDRDSMALAFVYISALYFVIMAALGALIVHKVNKGRKWAFVLLIPFALWSGYESISSPIELGRMYPGIVSWFDWAIAAMGGIVWGFILVHSASGRLKNAPTIS